MHANWKPLSLLVAARRVLSLGSRVQLFRSRSASTDMLQHSMTLSIYRWPPLTTPSPEIDSTLFVYTLYVLNAQIWICLVEGALKIMGRGELWAPIKRRDLKLENGKEKRGRNQIRGIRYSVNWISGSSQVKWVEAGYEWTFFRICRENSFQEQKDLNWKLLMTLFMKNILCIYAANAQNIFREA